MLTLSVAITEKEPVGNTQRVIMSLEKSDNSTNIIRDFRTHFIRSMGEYLLKSDFNWTESLICEVTVDIKPFSNFRSKCFEAIKTFENCEKITNVVFVDYEGNLHNE